MRIEQAVIQYMIEHGYDGLFSEYGECACKLGDIRPCGCDFAHCHLGYLCEVEVDVEKTWGITERKPEVSK